MIRLLEKTHNKTGLKYLCVTKKKDYEKYNGSGLYWRRHCKKHGYDIYTELIHESEEADEAFNEMCLEYSNKIDVVNSKEYANLVPEYGTVSWKNTYGYTEESKRLQKESLRIFWNSEDGEKIKKGNSEKMYYFWHSEEHKQDALRVLEKIKNTWSCPVLRAEHSERQKKYWEKLPEEKRGEFSKKVSEGRLNMSEEKKRKRAKNITLSFKKSEKRNSYVKRMKTERMGDNNPAAVKVFWKGLVFNTNTEFERYLEENKDTLNKEQCKKMINDPDVVDCYKIGRKKKEKTKMVCPHCGKISYCVKPSSMKRFHMDNCKFKESK